MKTTSTSTTENTNTNNNVNTTDKKKQKKLSLPKKSWKILAILFAIISLLLTVSAIFYKNSPKIYTSTATVIEIIPNDSENFTICFQLVNNRHIFCIETSENYEVGERYNLTFTNNKTVTILDDEIIEIKRPF